MKTIYCAPFSRRVFRRVASRALSYLCFCALLCVLIFSPRASVFAQDLRILSAKGDVKLKRGGATIPASAGEKIQANDALVTKTPCYVVVSSPEGKTLEIRAAVSWKASEIAAKLKASKESGVGGKLANYIFGELKNSSQAAQDNNQSMASAAMTERATKKNTETSAEIFGIASGETDQTGSSTSNKTAGEGVFGAAVSSALNSVGLGGLLGGETTKALADSAGASVRPPRVYLLFPRDSYVIEPNVRLRWSCERPDQTFIVRLFSPFGAVVFEQTTKDSSLRINARELLSDTAQCYRWSVAVANAEADPQAKEHCLSQAYPERERGVQDSVAAARRELGSSTALGYAAAGVLYERNRFFLPAFYAYSEAMRLAPDVEEYQLAFRHFARQWGLDDRFIDEVVANPQTTADKRGANKR